MPRFLAVEQANISRPASNGNHPFKDVYGAVEEENVYINMEAVQNLSAKMTTQRDMYVITDISGSMEEHYKGRGGFFSKKPSEIVALLSKIVSMIGPYDDDGVDVLFFSHTLAYHTNISNESQVQAAVDAAIRAPESFGTTQPIDAFEWVVQQMRQKKRPGTVFFLTDGLLDDRGAKLERFYENVLHKEFKTRDQFYCYAIEFGHHALGALEVLDGKFAPEQGPEDLFDMEFADNLPHITAVLSQVGAMSAIGSDDTVSVTVSSPAVLEMVNADLLPSSTTHVEGPINQVMSFRVKSTVPFDMTLRMQGYDDMVLHCVPTSDDVEITVR